MSEAVWMALVACIGSVATAGLTVATQLMVRRSERNTKLAIAEAALASRCNFAEACPVFDPAPPVTTLLESIVTVEDSDDPRSST